MFQISAEFSPVTQKQSSAKLTPCSPFAVHSLDLSMEQQSSLKIGESCESQRRIQTFSGTVHSKILNFSPYTHQLLSCKIKMSSSELWDQEEAAYMHIFGPTQTLLWTIYTDGSSKILKCCNLAVIAAITELLQT